MAFLFKSKKNQDRALGSRDGPPVAMSTRERVVRDEKGSNHRSTPTGSVHSIDNDGSLGSPDKQVHSRQRTQSGDQQAPPLNTAPQASGPPPPQQQSSDLPFRNAQTAPTMNPNPNPNPNNSSLYPWSQRKLTFTSTHPSPFPRYGAAVNSLSSKEGDIYVMGGLINSSTVKGDLWMIEAGGSLACYPLATTAEGPGPRVGHASLLVGNAFIVYGGDTKIEETDVLDETLYLLNTSTRQWSRALPAGPRPRGRYGHSLNIIGSKIYIFGGQVEGYFMNDLAAFDLNQLQMSNNRWEALQHNSDSTGPQANIPPARTNHSVVTFNEKMYLFGGTNGYQWFNDVWCYDAATNVWEQLDCIGYIPVPREGHAAALVDDVMYIFGGRTEEGADLGDLAAFRITSRRWYTFQNMGPSPSPRSGHSMTTVGRAIVIVGGEPSTAAATVSELSLVYCLDTTKIRYPNDTQASQKRRPSVNENAGQNTARSILSRDGSVGPPEMRRVAGAAREPSSANSSSMGNGHKPLGNADLSASNGNAASGSKPLKSPGPPAATTSATSYIPQQHVAATSKKPPSRTASLERTEYQPLASKRGTSSRNTSLERNDYQALPQAASSQTQSPVIPEEPEQPETRKVEAPTINGKRTPTTQQVAKPAPKQVEMFSVEAKGRPSRQHRVQNSVDSAAEASPAAPKQVVSRPTSPPPPTRHNSNTANRRSSNRNSQTVVLLKELDAARNRNAWYASELELARKQGYTPNASLSSTLDKGASETFDEDDKNIIEALLAMRTELANVQSTVDKQAVLAARQIAEVERQRDAAIQEAVYAKAKLACYTGGSAGTPQPDNERDADERLSTMARKLAAGLNTQKELQSQLERATAETDNEKRARKLADDTVAAAQKRLADLESYKQKNSAELERLKAELHMAQREVRERSVIAMEATAALEMLRLEKTELNSKYEEVLGSSKEANNTFESLRAAVAYSDSMRSMLEQKVEEERSQRETVEAKLTKLKADHEASTAELMATSQRLREAEELAERHANEARAHRQAVLAGLAKMTTRDAGATTKTDSDRIVALQGQLNAANALVRKYQQDTDNVSDKLRSAEERIAGLEQYQEQASREGVSIRRQLQSALRDTQFLQAANAELKNQLAAQQLETNAMTVQHNTLKDILTERGISPTAAGAAARARGLSSPREGSESPEQVRVRELEQQLAASQATHEELKASVAATAQETEVAYREKLAQLENDYQSAVHYVKGTEKMLRQLKEQLARYKTDNVRLKEQVVELENKVDKEVEGSHGAPAEWEEQRQDLEAKVLQLQDELKSSGAQLEKQIQAIQEELSEARRDRDTATQDLDELSHRLDAGKRDLKQLQEENALLEKRAQDAEQKVGSLLDQLEMSVDNYRRRSKNAPSMNSDTPTVTRNLSTSNGMGHIRQESGSEAESLYAERMGDARDSTALDNLADELDMLRSHWEATNKNYRLSNSFDFDGSNGLGGSGKTDAAGNGLGLSESLADWRKRLDDSHPDQPEAKK